MIQHRINEYVKYIVYFTALRKEADSVAKAEAIVDPSGAELLESPVNNEDQFNVESPAQEEVDIMKPIVDPAAVSEVASSCGFDGDDADAVDDQDRPQCDSAADENQPPSVGEKNMRRSRQEKRFESLLDDLLDDIMSLNEDFDDSMISVKESKKAMKMRRTQVERLRRSIDYYY